MNAQYDQIQKVGAQAVIREDVGGTINLVAAVDVAYSERHAFAVAAVVVYDLTSQCEVERKVAVVHGESVEYGFGYLSFRELPSVTEAVKLLDCTPDVFVLDGHGVAHPLGFGLASHVGVALGLRTIGCAKGSFVLPWVSLDEERGSINPVMYHGEQVGVELRTQTGVKPVYVSIGHQVSLETAISVILQAAPKYRQIEPMREANTACNFVRDTLEAEMDKESREVQE